MRRVAKFGGNYENGAADGIFAMNVNNDSSNANANIGSRLLFAKQINLISFTIRIESETINKVSALPLKSVWILPYLLVKNSNMKDRFSNSFETPKVVKRKTPNETSWLHIREYNRCREL